jgi:prepilin peptidase CpaA
MADIILFLVLGISLYTDLTRRRIYNWVTLPVMVLGIGLNTWQYGMTGLKQSLLGWAIGLFILFIPFMLGGISGGDIKLLAAIGALKGPAFILQAVLLTALVGGLYIMLHLIATKRSLYTLKNIKNTLYLMLLAMVGKKLSYLPSMAGETKVISASVPYGVAIFLGTLLTYILG